jgi:anti-anti-sigma factor
VTLPESIDVSNAGLIREQLLSLVNRGASPLVADMTGTLSCDHAGADALLRAYQRASVSGTRLRVVVTAPVVRRVLAVSGLDRLISIYPSVEAATAAQGPSNVIPLISTRRRPGWSRGPAQGELSPAVLLSLVDALADGVVLADGTGTIALANRRAAEIFGYPPGELTGQPVESLIPAELRTPHVGHRARYEQEPSTRPMGARSRLVGLRKDGSTVPIRISLSPVPTATGSFTLTVIRDSSDDQPPADLGELARTAAAARQVHRSEELLDRVINQLFQVGLSLQAAIELPQDEARNQIAAGLDLLDVVIGEIRDHVFGEQGRPG